MSNSTFLWGYIQVQELLTHALASMLIYSITVFEIISSINKARPMSLQGMNPAWQQYLGWRGTEFCMESVGQHFTCAIWLIEWNAFLLRKAGPWLGRWWEYYDRTLFAQLYSKSLVTTYIYVIRISSCFL